MPVDPKKRRSVADLQKEFVNRYFSDGEGFDVQPITLHDAAHQFANIQPSTRGELQQQIIDLHGAQNLHDLGMRGFVNAVIPTALENPYLFSTPVSKADAASAIEGLKNFSSLLERDSITSAINNDPSNFFVPRITDQEINELKKRGSEFYSQVGDQLTRRVQSGQIKLPVSDVVFPFITPPDGEQQIKIQTDPQAGAIHRNPEKLQIKGGYDVPGALPYGPATQYMNPPMQMVGLEKERGNWDLYNKTQNADYIPDPGDVQYETKRLFSPAKETFYGSGFWDKELAPTAINRLRLKNIIGSAATSAADIAGSVPLFDPSFRQAVEQGNASKAAKQMAAEYVAGTIAAPVVGMGLGALNQIAPKAARVLAGGLTAARVANPIAVVSQIGGSSRINPQADKAAIQSQFQRAEAARQRGSRWKFPTPFGTLAIPELGISESGGLFFR